MSRGGYETKSLKIKQLKEKLNEWLGGVGINLPSKRHIMNYINIAKICDSQNYVTIQSTKTDRKELLFTAR